MNLSPRTIDTPMLDRATEGWMRLVMSRARLALGVLALLMILSALAMTRLGVDGDSSRMLSPDLPAQQQAHAVNAAFPDLKTAIVIVLEADTPDMADLAVRALSESIEANAGETTWIDSYFSAANDPYLASNGFLFRDPKAVEEVFRRITLSSNLIAQLRVNQTLDGFAGSLDQAAALADRAEMMSDSLDKLYLETADVLEAAIAGKPRIFGWSSVLDDEAPQGPTLRLISVAPRLDLSRLSPAKPALEQIEALIATLPAELTDAVRISVTGEPALRAEEMRSILSTIWISMLLSLALVAIVLWIGLRSARGAGLAFASLMVSLVLTTGVTAIVIGTLNVISVAFIVLMVGLGIDFAIHILAHIHEMRRHGTEPTEAVTLTGRRTGTALATSAATTALAFLAFSTTDFDGMAQLGLIGGIGVLIAFGVAATLIPAMIAVVPGLSGTPSAKARADGPVQSVGKLSLAAPAAIVVLCALAIWPATQAYFDSDPMGLRNPASPSVVAFNRLADEPDTTPYRASILAETRVEALEIATAFENTPGIGAALSIDDLLPSDQDDKLEQLDLAAGSIDHAVNGIPSEFSERAAAGTGFAQLYARLDGREGAAKRLHKVMGDYLAMRSAAADAALQARIFRSFSLMLDRLSALLQADYVTIETLPRPLRQRFISSEGVHRVEILPEENLRDPTARDRFARIVQKIDPRASGGPIQISAASATISGAMLQATLLAGFAAALIALLTVRRVMHVIAILAPLVVAGVLTSAASFLLGVPFNYANVIVLPLLIGIGVDSGIHIALREHRAPGAVFATSTPRAVLFSALTTLAAFGTLSLSDHQGTASMGILLAVSMTVAVGCVLALTPALIRLDRKWHT